MSSARLMPAMQRFAPFKAFFSAISLAEPPGISISDDNQSERTRNGGVCRNSFSDCTDFIPPLSSASTYKFRVVAMNTYGESPHSIPSKLYQVPQASPRITERPVVGPHILSTDAISDTQIMLRWTVSPRDLESEDAACVSHVSAVLFPASGAADWSPPAAD